MKKIHSDFDIFAVEMRKLKGEKLKEFAESKKIDFPMISYENAKDFTHYIAQKAGWNGSMPFILIINKKGVVKFVQLGVLPKEGFEKIYQQIK
jgi:peroxiredoxin